ncbi:MAG: hypothetical protein P4L48_16605, partial [Mycobacterium sp.]|nr:hypothetical protein [Mycobacterium sp.]
ILRSAHESPPLPDRLARRRTRSRAGAIDMATDGVYESYGQRDMRTDQRKKSCTLALAHRLWREVRT